MSAFDYVCATLTCPFCGWYPQNPCAIDLQTKLARAPALRRLRVGDRVEVAHDVRSHYLRSADDSIDGDDRVIVETWTCTRCGANFNLAGLRVVRGALASIEVVLPTEERLRAIDYVTPELGLLVPADDPDRAGGLWSLAPEPLRRKIATIYDSWAEYRREVCRGLGLT